MNMYRHDQRQVIESRQDLDHRLDLSHGQDLDHRQAQRRSGPVPNRFARYTSFDKYRNGKSPERAVRDEDEEGVLFFQDCILKPPRNMESARNQLSNRPPGCRTITVARIPEFAQFKMQRLEAIFRDIFATNGGPIDICRMRPGRNCSCDVRFQRKESVDLALLVNGYQIVIRDELEPTIRFTINLNYLPFREDQQEYQAQKEMAERLELRPGQLPELIPFNAMNADKLSKKLKESEDQAVIMTCFITIRTWIEAGRINDMNVQKLVGILLLLSERLKKSTVEKNDLKKEMRAKRAKFLDALDNMMKESEQLASVFRDTKKQNCWDRLTGKHKKMIDMWSTHAKDLCVDIQQTFREHRKEADRGDAVPPGMEAKFKEKEKVIAIKEQEVSSGKKTIESLQQQLWEMAKKNQEKGDKLMVAEKELKELKHEKEQRSKETEVKLGKRRRLNYDMEVQTAQVDYVEGRILCLVSSLLRCYPEGASVDVLEKYLRSQKVMFEHGEIDAILAKFPQLFCMFFINDNGKNVKKWNMTLKR